MNICVFIVIVVVVVFFFILHIFRVCVENPGGDEMINNQKVKQKNMPRSRITCEVNYILCKIEEFLIYCSYTAKV